MKANISNIQKIYYEIPSRYVIDGKTIDNYDKLTENHFKDGWRDAVVPEISSTQKLSNDYVLSGDVVTKEVIDFTPEEIAEINTQKVQEYLSNIQTLYTSMFISSLSRATGKKGSKEELEAVREEYLDKYNVSKEYVNQPFGVTNQPLLDEMNDECERDFPGPVLEQTIAFLNATFGAGMVFNADRLNNFCQLVIFKYESGEVLWKKLKAFCSYFRTACITDIEQGQFAKCDQRIALAMSITNDSSVEDIENLVTQSKAL